jgi:curved DNA-binding protein CbpA
MSDERFRGDPYAELELRHDSTNTQIKRRWRELAREHHPDRAAGNREETARLTTRMARINAAYDLLRDPERRSAYDSSPAGRRARASGNRGARVEFEGDLDGDGGPAGPPPPPRTAPVTARFDTTTAFRPRNTRLSNASPLRGHLPRARRGAEERDLRASTPTGPVERRPGTRGVPMPTLQEARETVINFGKFHGYTLGEVELLDPAYIDWIARTITRDRDMVIRARLIEEAMDRDGLTRPSRAAASGPETEGAAAGPDARAAAR